MSRKLMAVLLSGALMLGNVSTSAWSAPGSPDIVQTQTVQTAGTVNNQTPLPPAGAAGIKEAQGFEDSPLLALGLVAAVVIIAWILIDNEDDDDEGTSTGTN